MVVGTFLLTRLGTESAEMVVWASMLLMGLGMGLTITSYLVAVQERVPRRRLGVATSSLQFIRQIGGTIGVSVIGAVMAARLTSGLATLPGGSEVNAQSLLDPSTELALPPAIAEAFQRLLADALQPAFYIAFGAVLVGLVIAFFTPRGTTRQLVADGQRDEARLPSDVPSEIRG